MAVAGDIVTTFGIDDAEWVAGVLRIQNSEKNLQGSMKGIASRNNELGRSLGQVGFAVQDFSSVLSMGGPNALSRAMLSTMNNVQMLGAAFGPWGLAITAAGGALGSILLPKLLETDNASKEFTKSLKEQVSELEKVAKAAGEATKFELSLPDMSSKSAESKAKSTERDVAGLESERATLERELQGMLLDARTKGQIRIRGGFDPETNLLGAVENMFPGFIRNPMGLTGEGVGTDGGMSVPLPDVMAEGATEVIAALKDVAKKIRDSDAEIALKRGEIEKLTATAGTAKERELFEKASEGRFKSFFDEAEKSEKKKLQDAQRAADLWMSTRTPIEAAVAKFEELQALAARGGFGHDLGRRAGKDIIDGFRKSIETDPTRKLTAPDARSAEGFSAIQASIRALKDDRKGEEQVRLLEQHSTKLDSIITELQKGNTQPQQEDSI